MFKKILIANRGEVALRIIRACEELGIKSVAIYSEADAKSLYVKKADEAYLIPGDPIRAYLDYVRIVDLAKSVGADAIHPGYGFLAENADFARYCTSKGITFIGPSPEHIELFGDKVKAKRKMAELGIPTIPGSPDPLKNYEDALHYAREIGFPVILKSAYGGGGRGMRIVRSEEELPRLFESGYREAETFFGKGGSIRGKVFGQPKTHRGADPRRQIRKCSPSWRKGLLGAKKTSEDHRDHPMSCPSQLHKKQNARALG
jgi:pyruvate carboxylase subunit A